MSPKFRQAGLLATAGVATVATFGASAAQAAQTAKLNYQCLFPLIGTQPLSLDVSLDIPSTWPTGEPTAKFPYRAKVSFGSSLPEAFAGWDGLHTLAGVTEAQKPGWGAGLRARVSLPDGTGVNIRVPLDIEPYTVVPPIPQPFVLEGGGATPSLSLDALGTAKVTLTELVLNLYALKPDGSPFPEARTALVDMERRPYADIDGDPNTFNVPCKLDPAGQSLQLAEFELLGPDVEPTPRPPTSLAGTSTATTATLTWSASTDPDGGPLTYKVFSGTAQVAESSGTTATITGLQPDTNYTYTVVTVDESGASSAPSPAFTIKTKPLTPPPPVKYGYTLKGSTTLKTLTKGTLPLNGSIAAELTLATGAISADLTLADTSGRLVAAGFLPVTAKIGFVPSGKTTGSLVDGELKTNSKVRIKVKEVKLFGAIPLAGGNNCQTKSLSDINLQSTQDEFSPLAGGPIAGTYKISDLNGCGALNGLVSPLTAGGGNTINLNLTPAA